jgi:hypothetical protein
MKNTLTLITVTKKDKLTLLSEISHGPWSQTNAATSGAINLSSTEGNSDPLSVPYCDPYTFTETGLI